MNGTATVVINPYGMFLGNIAFGIVGQNYFPFASMSSSNTGLVYNGATVYSGPFVNQIPNASGFLPDQLKTSFICTQSVLNAQGKIHAGLYYSAPNATFEFSNLGTFDGTATSITST